MNGLEINSDAERCAELVVAAVAFANAGGGIVDAAADSDAAETLRELLEMGLESWVGGEGDDKDLCGGYGGGK